MDPVNLTLNEAGYVVGQSPAAINRAVDRGIINAQRHPRGKLRLRMVGAPELRFLAIAGQVEHDLTPTARRKVYEAIRLLPPAADTLSIGIMEFRLSDIDRSIVDRLRRLRDIQAMIEERPAADPVLRGTEVSPYAVAAIAQGVTFAELAQAYPSLTPPQVEAATEYAKIYPRPGRPPPPRRFKQILADMAASGVWDIDIDETKSPATP